MIFLPIVERELRVAARKRSTFWLRVTAALVALVIGSGFLVLTTVGPFASGAVSLGRGLFATLTWLSLAAALSAGLFFTSDCLSEEKREGTLGFLFLTDLRSYDVVLGKLLSTSLRSFYGLLAVFPILGVTLLMGGVTGAQFWKSSLALVNALFLSLVAGLFVSAISRDSQKALAASLFLLLLLVAGGPAADATFAAIQGRAFNPALSLASPGFLFVTASAAGQTPFWPALFVNQVVAWTLLALACVLLPRAWQEKAAKSSARMGSWTQWWKFGGARRRAGQRRRFISLDPVLWLACRERWQALSLWTFSLLMTGGLAANFAAGTQTMWWFAWSYVSGALTLMLYLGLASQAGRFFVEAKRSGVIELLLATPLTAQQIVQGQWRGMLRMFGPPLVVYLASLLLGTVMVQQQTWSRMATAVPPAPLPMATTNSAAVVVTNPVVVTTTTIPTVTVTAGVSGFSPPPILVVLAMSFASTLTVAANLAALAWFGMWMGLNSRNANLATLKTILFVQIIPWFVVAFASALVVPLFLFPRLLKGVPTMPGQLMVWFPLLMTAIATTLNLAKDFAFVVWARRKLYSEFRERALQAVAPIQPPPSPPQDRPIAPAIAPG